MCGERRGVGGHSSTLSLVHGFSGQGEGLQRGKEKVDVGGEERVGGEGRGGAGVAFVCFPRFKASLEK